MPTSVHSRRRESHWKSKKTWPAEARDREHAHMSTRQTAGAHPTRTSAERPIPIPHSNFRNPPVPKIQQSDGTSNHACLPSSSRARAKYRLAGRMPAGPTRPSAWTQNEAKATACAIARAHTKRRAPVANDCVGGEAARSMRTSYSVPCPRRVNPLLLQHIELYDGIHNIDHRACYIENVTGRLTNHGN